MLVPKNSKRGRTSQGYKGVHGKFEEENRHVSNVGMCSSENKQPPRDLYS